MRFEKHNNIKYTNEILKVKACNKVQGINKVDEISNGNFAIIGWKPVEVKGEKLIELIEESIIKLEFKYILQKTDVYNGASVFL